jgi:hypothetical protein
MASPEAGFPQMVASDAELEGVYRFLSNENHVSTDTPISVRDTPRIPKTSSFTLVMRWHADRSARPA